MVILSCLFLLLIASLLSVVYWSWRNGISPMPTSSKAKKHLLADLPANFKGVIFELGSGWGTLAFPLAEKFPQCQVIALESSPVPFFFSKFLHFLNPLPNLTFYRKDFFSVPLSEAGLIVCYLYPEAMRQLKTKFQQELQPGTWIISNTFAIPGLAPVKVDEVDDLYHSKIYLYRVG